MKTCSVENCPNAQHAKGFCSVHYGRWRRNGDPLIERRARKGEPLKFICEFALLHTGDECLTWPFAVGSDGRALVKLPSRLWTVSRLICIGANGPPPTSKHEAAHTCGNGHLACVNPRHLVWKTHAENMDDTIAHGTRLEGEKHPNAKLTIGEVEMIISLKGILTQKAIADRFGVSKATIYHIHKGNTWKARSELDDCRATIAGVVGCEEKDLAA